MQGPTVLLSYRVYGFCNKNGKMSDPPPLCNQAAVVPTDG